MTGAQAVVAALEREGVETIFGYPGGAIMPLYDALYEHRVRHILVRHEAAAAFAASGFARTSGRVGVCCATSGPGATNLVTGLLDAMMDSVPVVAITGQVRTELMGTDGFQEPTSARSPRRSRSATSSCPAPTDRAAIAEAFALARGGRPGRCSSTSRTTSSKRRSPNTPSPRRFRLCGRRRTACFRCRGPRRRRADSFRAAARRDRRRRRARRRRRPLPHVHGDARTSAHRDDQRAGRGIARRRLVPGHARHARAEGGEQGRAARRPVDRARHAIRRPRRPASRNASRATRP